jgi:N-acetylmuramoyl-L-alanine amidase
VRERLDHRDRLIRSVAFDDSDGTAKILVELTDEAADVRLSTADENRVVFVDFARSGAITAAPLPADAALGDRASNQGSVRVIVIDPGHGGADMGTKNLSVTEKDITLALARALRSSLQRRLGATVLLTRDDDIELDNETRSAVANNNQADFFVSLHVGYSPNKMVSDASIFVMKQDYGGTVGTASSARDQLFLPWYLGYRTNRARSLSAARFLREELLKAVPEWTFPVQTAPLGVLTSATMPSLMLELGNLNNAVNSQTLTDTAFQNSMVGAIVNAIERFSQTETNAAN